MFTIADGFVDTNLSSTPAPVAWRRSDEINVFVESYPAVIPTAGIPPVNPAVNPEK